MLYREIIAVCSEIHTKHINKLCGQNVELLNVIPVGVCAVSPALNRFTAVCYIIHSYKITWPFYFSSCLIPSFSRLPTISTQFSSVIFSSKQFCLSTSSDRNTGRDLSPPRSADCELLPSLFSVHQSLLLTSHRFLRILDISDIDALCVSGWT